MGLTTTGTPQVEREARLRLALGMPSPEAGTIRSVEAPFWCSQGSFCFEADVDP